MENELIHLYIKSFDILIKVTVGHISKGNKADKTIYSSKQGSGKKNDTLSTQLLNQEIERNPKPRKVLFLIKISEKHTPSMATKVL